MGRMSELHIEICEANGGLCPSISVEQILEMKRLNLLNIEQYEKHLESERKKKSSPD